MERKIISIWDLPTRLFHWFLVVLFIAAIASAKLEMMQQHALIGICMAGLLFFRILWGFFGSDTARFTFFLKGPNTIRQYIKGRHDYLGHNPLGALLVCALILLLSLQIIFGLFGNDEILFEGPLAQFISPDLSNKFTGWHHKIADILIALTVIHVFAVLFYVFVKKENIILEMLTGNKFVTFIPVHLPLFVSLLRAIIFLILSLLLIFVLFNI